MKWNLFGRVVQREYAASAKADTKGVDLSLNSIQTRKLAGKKILLIIPDLGSFNNFLSDLARRLIDENAKVVVISSASKVIDIPDRFNFTREPHFTFYSLEIPRGFKVRGYGHAVRAIRKIVKAEKPDLIHAHFTAGILALSLSLKRGFPVSIATFHGMNATISRGVAKVITTFAEYFCVWRLDKTYVLNEEDQKAVAKVFPEKVSLVPTLGFGCDLARFDPSKVSEESTDQLRVRLGLKKEDFVITFIGRTVFFKGYDITCRAFLLLSEKHPGLKLLVLGGKDQIHPTGLSAAEEGALSVNPNFIYLGYQSNVQEFLALTSIMVFPSLKEGMPVCIMEALAMGVPVITANTRGCSRLIEQGKNGYLIEGKDLSALVDILQECLENPKELRQIKRAILDERARFDRNHYVDYQLQVYDALLLTRNVKNLSVQY